MYFFTTLRKNPATSTYATTASSHAASCTNLCCKSSRIEPTCPSFGPATFYEGSWPRRRTQPGDVYIRSCRIHARSFRTNFVQVSPLQSAHFCCDRLRLYSAVPLGQRAKLNLSSGRHLPLGLDFRQDTHQQQLPLVGRQQPLLLVMFLDLHHAATFADAAPSATYAAWVFDWSAPATTFADAVPATTSADAASSGRPPRRKGHQVNFIDFISRVSA